MQQIGLNQYPAVQFTYKDGGTATITKNPNGTYTREVVLPEGKGTKTATLTQNEIRPTIEDYVSNNLIGANLNTTA